MQPHLIDTYSLSLTLHAILPSVRSMQQFRGLYGTDQEVMRRLFQGLRSLGARSGSTYLGNHVENRCAISSRNITINIEHREERARVDLSAFSSDTSEN